jgi:ACS family hexuronate transporter-like MFS transporter
VASVIGIAGFAGAMGGVLFQRATGRILDATGHNYTPIFLVCGLAYVSAWAIIHILVPGLAPAQVSAAAGTRSPIPGSDRTR